MTRILLVRHGDTAYNIGSVFRGTLDVPLNDTGREQARLTGLELSGTEINHIASSPLSRALDTARAIAEHQHTASKPVIEPAFTDLNFGDWQGHPKDEIAASYPELFEQWMREPHKVRFPGGETLADASARASRALNRLIREFPGKTVAIVSHRVIIKLLILHMLGLPESDFWRIHVDTCGITTFDYAHNTHQFILIRHNHNAHLCALHGKVASQDF